MKAKNLIDVLGGCQNVASILNEQGLQVHTRQRIWNWYKKDRIPDWAQYAYPKIWRKAEVMIEKQKKAA